MTLEEALFAIRNLVKDQKGSIDLLHKINDGLARKLEESHKENARLRSIILKHERSTTVLVEDKNGG
jgi:hypothetical protein